MKAASEEVKNIFANSNQKVDPKHPQLILTREQLDNMPVLGTVLTESKTSYMFVGSIYDCVEKPSCDVLHPQTV